MPLDIKRELAAVNKKHYDFYQQLDDQEKKEFSPYVLMRFVSNASGDQDIQEWFIELTNELVNKHHWLLSKEHKHLLWLLFAASGAGVNCSYQYLAFGQKAKTNKLEKLIAQLHPSMKMSDVKLHASLMSKAETKQLFDDLGLDKKQRKEFE